MSEIPFILQRFTYRDLEKAGYGSRVTIWRKVCNGIFPKPQNDGGKNTWTGAQLLEINNQQDGKAA